MKPLWEFLDEHVRVTRRFFLGSGVAGGALQGWWSSDTRAQEPAATIDPACESFPESFPEPLREAISKLEPYFTPAAGFRDVSRGKPIPHTLDDEQKKAAGLTRETWKLEVISDPEHPAKIRRPVTLTFDELVELGSKQAVRFPKVMTCLNIGCPLGMGIWEGVPLRDVVWMTKPTENLRRVHYWGFHNQDPEQRFRSSLPIGRVLEDPFDLPPVILAYKLNGDWLDSTRGGPVRIVVPEAYGFKSVKWLTHVVLSNLWHANDTYANGNNDIDSPLKSFAATLHLPRKCKTNEMVPVTGYAQVGVSGLRKVQVSIHRQDHEWPAGDPYYDSATWHDATILGPPKTWGGNLPEGKIPADTLGFDPDSGKPIAWPPPLGKAHWAIALPGMPPGDYVVRCRTIDSKGMAQPRPRPFQKSGHAALEQVDISVESA